MKTRLKNKAEKQHDSKMINDAVSGFVEMSAEFYEEYAECDDVMHRTFTKFRDAKYEHDRALEISRMTKVGAQWGHGVTGIYRYYEINN